MYHLLKSFLFRLDAEKAHHLTMKLFRFGLKTPLVSSFLTSEYRDSEKKLHKNLVGLDFKNPIGLAAGFDKDGKYYHDMQHLGFGFLELGTVTPRPQKGNPQPRLFRLPKDEALINRMGFNNDGVDALVSRLKKYGKPEGVIIGGNIGKNKDTPNEQAVDDYIYCFQQLHDYVDYFVVNVSSPNTPGLRALQGKEALSAILMALVQQDTQQQHPKPIFLKIAPDLTDSQLDDIKEIITSCNIAGIITTNTTISRAGLTSSNTTVEAIGNGGLSGKPLQTQADHCLSYLRTIVPNETVIIASGGVHDVAAAVRKFELGADLVQVYSGLIYQGPSFVKEINKELARRDVL